MFWRIGQLVAVLAIVALIILGAVWPSTVLPIFWNVVVPLVPVSLLLAPELWRGVCPLATANTLTNGLVSHRRLSAKSRPYLQVVSLSLLFLLIPARRFLLNEDGIILGILLGSLLLLALIVGSVFDAKAGFCNSICPVLPVEKLYGQHPLIKLDNVRCSTCTLCTAKGCFDLAPNKAAALSTGGKKDGRRWLISGFGIFALAFPGLILGYFQMTDVSPAEALNVYRVTLGLALASFIVLGSTFMLFNTTMKSGIRTLAALAAVIYYWYAPVSMAETLGFDSGFVGGVRMIAFMTISYWFYRAVTDQRHHQVTPPGSIKRSHPSQESLVESAL